MANVVVGLVTSSLLSVISDHLFDLFLYELQVGLGQLLRNEDLSRNFVVNFVVFMSHFIFNLAYLRFDNCKGLFNLEVCDLGNHRLDLIFDLLDKFPSFGWV